MGSTVGKDRSHLDEQAGYDGKRGRHEDKTCATRSSGQVGRKRWVTHFPVKKLQKFQEYSSIEQSYWNQKLATMEKLPIFDDGDTEELEHDDRKLCGQNDSSHDSRFEAEC